MRTYKWKTNHYSQVPIKPEYCKCFPFVSLQSRAATATILMFTGYDDDLIPLILLLSHIARAYLHNANMLKGFLIRGIIGRLQAL